MTLIIYMLLAYLALSVQASVLTHASTAGHFTASLIPVMILLAFRWLTPLVASITCAFLALYLEMLYAAPPGSALILTTFLALLLTQPTCQRLLTTPMVFLLSCFPIVFLYDYALILLSELLVAVPESAQSDAQFAQLQTLSMTYVYGSTLVAIRTLGIVAVAMTISLGLKASTSMQPAQS